MSGAKPLCDKSQQILKTTGEMNIILEAKRAV